MKNRNLYITAIFCFCAVVLFGQTSPSPLEANTTCMTLARVLDIMSRQNQGADSAALIHAYKIVRRYADSSALKDTDEYMDKFQASNPNLAALYSVRRTVGFNNHTIEDLAGLYSDDEHKSHIFVTDKNQNVSIFHSDLDSATVGSIVSKNAGTHKISGGRK